MNSNEVLLNNPAHVTEALRKAAQTNKTFHDICFVFAMRERTRFEVNVISLRLSMAQEGYELKVKDIEQALVFLASLGIGKLKYDDKKRLVGLVEIRWTLQSIGKAALGEALAIVKSHKARKYQALAYNSRPPATPVPIKHNVSLSTIVAGKEIKFPLSTPLTSEELVQLIANFNASVVGRGH